MLNCRQVLSELSNYLDDEVNVDLAREIIHHLMRCHRCWVIYNTTGRTLEILSDALPPSVPKPVSERLHAKLEPLYSSSGKNLSE